MIKLINWLLDKIFRRFKPNLDTSSELEILNYCLSLAQEWGPNWMNPIDDRLRKLYPKMNNDKVIYYSRIAKESMNDGYELVSKLIADHGIDKARELFKNEIRMKYKWIDDSNISHLFSTGTYYHHK